MKPRAQGCPGSRQNGLALLALLAIIGAIGLFFFVNGLSSSQLRAGRDAVDAAALSRAKDALIAYAATVALTPAGARRPGDLPCPDLNNDGDKESSCGSAGGSLQAQRLGRLPWRTLRLPDLRDSTGERLWYAVSNSFKENTRRNPLNSDTVGTITVRDASGAIIFDGSGSTGVVAVIIAPGAALAGQDRSAAGENTPANYLESALGEDNAAFIDNGTDGIIQGPIRDVGGNVLLNDRIIVITRDEIMTSIEKRVAGEALNCLTEYAGVNQGRFPWTAPLNPLLAPSYDDAPNTPIFGRIPNTPFSQTIATSAAMTDDWTGACNIASSSGWWFNNDWKEMTFFALADAYKPAPLVPAAACGVTGTCLTVNPPSPAASIRVAVFVAGRTLPGQLRGTNAQKGTIANYLEGENATSNDVFSSLPRGPTANDTVVYR